MSPAPRNKGPSGLQAPLLEKALAHHRSGRLSSAEAAYAKILRATPRHPVALYSLGVLYLQKGQAAKAVRTLGDALEQVPDCAECHNNHGTALDRLGRLAEAEAAYRRAIALDPDMESALFNLGRVLERQARPLEAVGYYQAAIEADPRHADAFNSLGLLLKSLNRLPAAREALETACDLSPGSAGFRANLGNLLRRMGEPDLAIGQFAQALDLAPGSRAALLGLATTLEQASRLPEARQTAERVLSAFDGDPNALLIVAQCDLREQGPDAARRRLAGIDPDRLSDESRRAFHFLEGQILDRSGDADAAFAAFRTANRLAAGSVSGLYDKDAYRRGLADRRRIFSPERLRGFAASPSAGEAPAPVFLVGFPRSGTTLLEQVLDSHPMIQTIGETEATATLKGPGTRDAAAAAAWLDSLTEDGVRDLRKAYRAAAASLVERRPGTLLLDKLPLNMVDAGYIWRAFPDARFLFALRHPCDVCLSCFMQDFRVNDAMASFFTVEDAARLYVEAMDLWRHYRRHLPLRVREVRYEDTVRDLEAQARAVLGFLGLPWDDRVLSYADHAKRKAVLTPSYSQVTEGIHDRARGRWTRYADHMAAAQRLLDPDIDILGYG